MIKSLISFILSIYLCTDNNHHSVMQAIAVSGYASLGDTVQGSILESYPQAPVWVIDMVCNALYIHWCVCLCVTPSVTDF